MVRTECYSTMYDRMIEVVAVEVEAYNEWLTDSSREASELSKFSFVCSGAPNRGTVTGIYTLVAPRGAEAGPYRASLPPHPGAVNCGQ